MLKDLLSDYAAKNRISFSMPGHKHGKGLDNSLSDFGRLDLTELSDTDNLHNPHSAILMAKKRLSEISRSDESFFLVGGSTSGIHAMIAAACKRGDTLLAARSVHKSVVNACIIFGINIEYIPQHADNLFGLPIPPDAAALDELINKHSPSAILITSPDYFGKTADIAAFAEIAHKNNLPLLVDEAHGAHFMAGGSFPKTAISSGADVAVQSAHKTLNAINQAAYLHVKSEFIDHGRISRLLAMLQTSSPCYPIVATAESALSDLGKWENNFRRCQALANAIKSGTSLEIYPNDDPTRLVVNTNRLTVNASQLISCLANEYSIEAELAFGDNAVFIITPTNTDSELEALKKALCELSGRFEGSRKKSLTFENLPPERRMSPSEAFYSEGESVRIEDAVGRISKTTLTPYPPGIPVLTDGELVTDELCRYIKYLINSDAEVEGLLSGKITVVK